MIGVTRSILSCLLCPHLTRRNSAARIRDFSLTSLVVTGLMALSAVVFAAATVSNWAWFPKTTQAERQLAATPTLPRLEAELITLTPRGFEPSQITRPQGQFLLAVDNRSGLYEVTFRLDRETGNRLHEMSLPTGMLKWRNLVNLPPGNYLLTEARDPQKSCRITITPR